MGAYYPVFLLGPYKPKWEIIFKNENHFCTMKPKSTLVFLYFCLWTTVSSAIDLVWMDWFLGEYRNLFIFSARLRYKERRHQIASLPCSTLWLPHARKRKNKKPNNTYSLIKHFKMMMMMVFVFFKIMICQSLEEE